MGIFDFLRRKQGRPEEWMAIREEHYTKQFGPMTEQVMHSTDVKEVHVDIYTFRPSSERDYWTLITGGMSDRRQYVPRQLKACPRAEILLYAREPANWMYDVLKGLAEMPFDDRTFLHWHHTVPNAQPMTAQPSELTSFFFLPPYFEGTPFDSLHIDGDKVNILRIVPISERERECAIRHGSQALDDLLTEADLDPAIDEGRKSLL